MKKTIAAILATAMTVLSIVPVLAVTPTSTGVLGPMYTKTGTWLISNADTSAAQGSIAKCQDLIIDLTNNAAAGDTINLSLANGTFKYADDRSGLVAGTNYYQQTLGLVPVTGAPNYVIGATANGATKASAPTVPANLSIKTSFNTAGVMNPSQTVTSDAAVYVADPNSVFDGTYVSGGNPAATLANPQTGDYEVPFKMDVKGSNATITLLDGLGSQAYVGGQKSYVGGTPNATNNLVLRVPMNVVCNSDTADTTVSWTQASTVVIGNIGGIRVTYNVHRNTKN